MVLDDLDRALLRQLQQDARLSHRELARRTGSSAPTVGTRVERMEQLGIIQGYTVVLDPERFGATAADGPDLDAPVTVPCHTCSRETGDPVWERIGDRRHPFCCPTCAKEYRRKYDRLQKGL